MPVESKGAPDGAPLSFQGPAFGLYTPSDPPGYRPRTASPPRATKTAFLLPTVHPRFTRAVAKWP